jgi:hypothetical protein
LVNALHGDVLGQVLFACPAFVAWLIGRACHYVLDGDAAALWESTLLAPRAAPAGECFANATDHRLFAS